MRWECGWVRDGVEGLENAYGWMGKLCLHGSGVGEAREWDCFAPALLSGMVDSMNGELSRGCFEDQLEREGLKRV
jgi:hypothetical protein